MVNNEKQIITITINSTDVFLAVCKMPACTTLMWPDRQMAVRRATLKITCADSESDDGICGGGNVLGLIPKD
jgi:hypothetical protein